MGSMFTIMMKVYPSNTGLITGWASAATSVGYILGMKFFSLLCVKFTTLKFLTVHE